MPLKTRYYSLESAHVDPARLKRERDRARAFRKTRDWALKAGSGLCHYCEGRFRPAELSLDHVVPLARGGRSTPGNMVAACRPCNQSKRLDTPVDLLLAGESR